MDREIERILNEVIRPKLNTHGGDIGDYSLRDGVFRFRFLGECARCPSAWITAEQIVAKSLLAELPQIKTVQLDQGVSQDLQDQAIQILNKRRLSAEAETL